MEVQVIKIVKSALRNFKLKLQQLMFHLFQLKQENSMSEMPFAESFCRIPNN